MKQFIQTIGKIGLVAALIGSIGCEKNAKDEAFGDPKVFMPQAQIAALRYNVPNTGIGLDSATRNYQVLPDSIKIILGISRSGTVSTEAYSAEVYRNADTIAQLLSNGVFNPATAMELPTEIYSLPTKVDVPSGQAGSTFYLTINRQKLKMYEGKTVLLSVGVRNPSRYTLNSAFSKVIVVINVTSLNL